MAKNAKPSKPAKISAALESGLKHTEALLAIPSATNRVEAVADYVVAHAKKRGFTVERDPDDTLRITLPGRDTRRVVGYGAHLDRIGLMVDELMDDGTVRVSAIGGLYPGHVMDGVIASIALPKGKLLEGVLTHTDTPIHKVGMEGFQKREHKFEKIRLRPDACIGCTKKTGKAKLKELGVKVGQLVWLDPLLRIDHEAQTLRSRWLDNTLGCAVLLALMDVWGPKIKPQFTVDLIFSVAEEAGMGGTSVVRPGLTDFIAVDVGIGEEAEDISNLFITQKAGRFPYSARLVEELEDAADVAKADYESRTFQGGGTDAEQARSSGFKGRTAYIAIPIYGMHSIEAATFNSLEGVIKTLHTHATGQVLK